MFSVVVVWKATPRRVLLKRHPTVPTRIPSSVRMTLRRHVRTRVNTISTAKKRIPRWSFGQKWRSFNLLVYCPSTRVQREISFERMMSLSIDWHVIFSMQWARPIISRQHRKQCKRERSSRFSYSHSHSSDQQQTKRTQKTNFSPYGTKVAPRPLPVILPKPASIGYKIFKSKDPPGSTSTTADLSNIILTPSSSSSLLDTNDEQSATSTTNSWRFVFPSLSLYLFVRFFSFVLMHVLCFVLLI